VIVGADKFSGMAVFSRYATAHFRHPVLTTQTAEFVKGVKEALQRYSPQVYLPMGDDTYVAAKYIAELQETGVTIPIAPFETIKMLAKKNEVVTLAKALGIPVPETIVPQNDNDIQSFCKEYGSPIVLKPISSSGARGVFYLTVGELAKLRNGDSPSGKMLLRDCVLQQYIKGVGIGVSMLFNHGKLRAKFTHKRLKEKTVTGGVSTLRIGVVNPLLEEYAQRLLENANFHGVAMVEFKYDAKTGKGWLIEVNPRFWGSLALAIQSGVDFPYLLYRMATEGDVFPVVEYRTGLVVKWILGDIAAVVGQLNRPRSSPSNSRADLRVHGYDDFYRDDPFPFFAGVALSLRKFISMRNWTPDDVDLNIDRLE
jgi:predicted ATP-grasp superfamily ATP-dependent carboligase